MYSADQSVQEEKLRKQRQYAAELRAQMEEDRRRRGKQGFAEGEQQVSSSNVHIAHQPTYQSHQMPHPPVHPQTQGRRALSADGAKLPPTDRKFLPPLEQQSIPQYSMAAQYYPPVQAHKAYDGSVQENVVDVVSKMARDQSVIIDDYSGKLRVVEDRLSREQQARFSLEESVKSTMMESNVFMNEIYKRMSVVEATAKSDSQRIHELHEKAAYWDRLRSDVEWIREQFNSHDLNRMQETILQRERQLHEESQTRIFALSETVKHMEAKHDSLFAESRQFQNDMRQRSLAVEGALQNMAGMEERVTDSVYQRMAKIISTADSKFRDIEQVVSMLKGQLSSEEEIRVTHMKKLASDFAAMLAEKEAEIISRISAAVTSMAEHQQRSQLEQRKRDEAQARDRDVREKQDLFDRFSNLERVVRESQRAANESIDTVRMSLESTRRELDQHVQNVNSRFNNEIEQREESDQTIKSEFVDGMKTLTETLRLLRDDHETSRLATEEAIKVEVKTRMESVEVLRAKLERFNQEATGRLTEMDQRIKQYTTSLKTTILDIVREELKVLNEQYARSYADLVVQLKQVRKRVKEGDQRATDIEASILEFKDQANSRFAQIDESFQIVVANVTQVKSELDDAAVVLGNAIKEIDALKLSRDSIETTLQSHLEKLEEHETSIMDAQNVQQKLKESLDAAEQKIMAAFDDINKLRKLHGELNEAMMKKTSSLYSELSNFRSQTNKQFQVLEENFTKLVTTEHEQMITLTSELKQGLEFYNQSMSTGFAKAKKDMDSTVEALSLLRKDHNSLKDETARDISHLQADTTSIQETIDQKINVKIDEMDASLKAVTHQSFKKLESDMSQVQVAIQKLETETSTAIPTKLKLHGDNLDKMKQELGKLALDHHATENSLEKAHHDIQELSVLPPRLAEVSVKVDGLSRQLEDVAVSNRDNLSLMKTEMKGDVETAKKESLREAEKLWTEATNLKALINQEHSSFTKDFDQLRTNMLNTNAEISKVATDLSRVNGDAASRFTKLERDVTDVTNSLSTKVDEIYSQIDTIKTESEESQQEIRTNLQNVTSKIGVLDQHSAEIKAAQDAIAKNLSAQNAKNTAYDQKMETLEKTVVPLAQIESLVQKVDGRLTESLKEVNLRVGKNTEDLELSQKSVKALGDKLVKMEADTEEFKTKMASDHKELVADVDFKMTELTNHHTVTQELQNRARLELAEELNSKLAKIDTDVKLAVEDLSQKLATEASIFLQRSNETNEKVSNTNSSIEEITKRLEKSIDDHAKYQEKINAEMVELAAKVETATAKVVEEVSEKLDLESLKANFAGKQEFMDAKVKIDSAHGQLQEANEKVETIKNDVQELKNKGEKQSLSQEVIKELTAPLEAKISLLEEVVSKLARPTSSQAAADETRLEQTMKLNEQGEELDEVRGITEGNAAKIESMEGTIQTMDERLAALEKSIQGLEDGRGRSTLPLRSTMNPSGGSNVDQISEQVSNVKFEMKEVRGEIEELRKLQDVMLKKIDDCDGDIEDLYNRIYKSAQMAGSPASRTSLPAIANMADQKRVSGKDVAAAFNLGDDDEDERDDDEKSQGNVGPNRGSGRQPQGKGDVGYGYSSARKDIVKVPAGNQPPLPVGYARLPGTHIPTNQKDDGDDMDDENTAPKESGGEYV
eukprot:TRINITY_DN7121_c0_g1_i1.p1 TRINITY_DN7121_c0_g1~~TRINITY_DN7121_c0_g1_i1.p1  ORF type:complete len:1662 (+),score=490.71 TRINITY_DN7121_c0_g1_i1:40-5025(+)